MASDLVIQSNESSALLRTLVDAETLDISYNFKPSYPLLYQAPRAIRPKQDPNGAPAGQEVIFDLNKYMILRNLEIRTTLTKGITGTGDFTNPPAKFYGLSLYEWIQLRTNNKVIMTLSDSYIRARVDNLPDHQKQAVLRRALALDSVKADAADLLEDIAGGDDTSFVTYTPIFSTFFEDVRNNLNLNFLEQFQVACKFNSTVASGSNEVYTSAVPELWVWSWIPDQTYLNFLTAKNHKEGGFLNMLTYNSYKETFPLGTDTTATTTTAKLRCNYPVFNIHFAIVSKLPVANDGSSTAIAPIDNYELRMGGVSVSGVVPYLVGNYEKEMKGGSCNVLTNASAIERVQPNGTSSYSGWSTIPFSLEMQDRTFCSGAVSFNNINVPELVLNYPTRVVANFELQVVYEYWNTLTINDQGICNLTQSY